MFDVVGGRNLGGDVQISIVEQLFVVPADDAFVGFQGQGGEEF